MAQSEENLPQRAVLMIDSAPPRGGRRRCGTPRPLPDVPGRADEPFSTKPVLIVAIERAVVGHLGVLLEAGLTRRRSCQTPVGVGHFLIRTTR